MDEEVEESAEETTGESTGESSGAGMQGSCGKLKLNGTVQFYKMSVVREPAFGQVIFGIRASKIAITRKSAKIFFVPAWRGAF
jgi:hypothetical protein